MNILTSKSYNNGKILAIVTDDQPATTRYVSLLDIDVTEFSMRAYKDLIGINNGTNKSFDKSDDGKYSMTYRLGMYGMLIISIEGKDVLEELINTRCTKMYLACAMAFAIEELVLPKIEAEGV